MRSLRVAGVYLLLTLGAVAVAAAPVRADDDDRRWRRGGFFNRWYGGYSNPYYWNSRNYNYSPYTGYNPYRNWYGTRTYSSGYNRGYYNAYPYYNWNRTYPYSMYW